MEYMIHGPINGESIATVDVHIEILAKVQFRKLSDQIYELQDYWSKAPSIDLRPIGRLLVGQGHCLLPILC